MHSIVEKGERLALSGRWLVPLKRETKGETTILGCPTLKNNMQLVVWSAVVSIRRRLAIEPGVQSLKPSKSNLKCNSKKGIGPFQKWSWVENKYPKWPWRFNFDPQPNGNRFLLTLASLLKTGREPSTVSNKSPFRSLAPKGSVFHLIAKPSWLNPFNFRSPKACLLRNHGWKNLKSGMPRYLIPLTACHSGNAFATHGKWQLKPSLQQ